MRRPLVAGNWKMHLTHLEAIALVQKLAFELRERELEQVEVAVIPPFTSIRGVQTLTDGDHLGLVYGAQDVSAHSDGAYTGEVSAAMLAKLGCTYAIVGHSERRQYHDEGDALVAAKARAASAGGLTPLVCVGEPQAVRESGRHVEVVLASLEASLEGLAEKQLLTVVVAYEPVWAIGTGHSAGPEDAQEMCGAIRGWLRERHGDPVAEAVRVLYGGSVKPGSAGGLLAQPDVDGALVGGASLVAADFAAIVRAAL